VPWQLDHLLSGCQEAMAMFPIVSDALELSSAVPELIKE